MNASWPTKGSVMILKTRAENGASSDGLPRVHDPSVIVRIDALDGGHVAGATADSR